MRVRVVLFCWGVGGLLALASCSAVRAQDAPEPPRPAASATLFPQPTGQNGYEEWVQAGDLIRNNALVEAAAMPDATLTLKRRLLADPDVVKALHLLREGLNKPALTPHALLDENATYPELRSFRKLAHLLAIEQYVRFANGNGDGAIESLSDGLRFGYRVQTTTLIAGLHGIIIDIIVLHEFSSHLEQLSDYQCSRVRHIVEEWLAWPVPVDTILSAQKQDHLHRLETMRSHPEDLLASLAADSSPDDPASAALTRALNTQPDAIGSAVDRAELLTNAYFEAALANLKLPVKERKLLTLPKENTPGGHLFAMMTGNLDYSINKYDRLEAQMRLLGVEAAIRSYRWEYARLPDSLAALHVGKLSLDPFTGDNLLYKREGARYELHTHQPVDL